MENVEENQQMEYVSNQMHSSQADKMQVNLVSLVINTPVKYDNVNERYLVEVGDMEVMDNHQVRGLKLLQRTEILLI